jgi:hypothetical protein
LKGDTLNRIAWGTALEDAGEIVARRSVMMMMMTMQLIFIFSEGTDILGLAECYSQFLYDVPRIVF